MACAGDQYIVLHSTSGVYLILQKSVLAKMAIVGCFGVKIAYYRGVANSGTVGQIENKL